MIILSRGTQQINNGGGSGGVSTPYTFVTTTPVYQGELFQHNLGTLTPNVSAVDSSGNNVSGLSVEPVYTNPYYSAYNLSRLVYNSAFVGTITLTN